MARCLPGGGYSVTSVRPLILPVLLCVHALHQAPEGRVDPPEALVGRMDLAIAPPAVERSVRRGKSMVEIKEADSGSAALVAQVSVEDPCSRNALFKRSVHRQVFRFVDTRGHDGGDDLDGSGGVEHRGTVALCERFADRRHIATLKFSDPRNMAPAIDFAVSPHADIVWLHVIQLDRTAVPADAVHCMRAGVVDDRAVDQSEHFRMRVSEYMDHRFQF